MNLTSTMAPAAVPLTMSSREIAELTGKDHRHVGQHKARLAQEGSAST